MHDVRRTMQLRRLPVGRRTRNYRRLGTARLAGPPTRLAEIAGRVPPFVGIPADACCARRRNLQARVVALNENQEPSPEKQPPPSTSRQNVQYCVAGPAAYRLMTSTRPVSGGTSRPVNASASALRFAPTRLRTRAPVRATPRRSYGPAPYSPSPTLVETRSGLRSGALPEDS